MITKFQHLCQKHNLRVISVMFQRTYPKGITVYLHFGEDGCESATGQTFNAAFEAALTDVEKARGQN